MTNPQRRLRHGQRPTKPLDWSDTASQSQAVPSELASLQRYDHLGCLMTPDQTGDYYLASDVQSLFSHSAATGKVPEGWREAISDGYVSGIATTNSAGAYVKLHYNSMGQADRAFSALLRLADPETHGASPSAPVAENEIPDSAPAAFAKRYVALHAENRQLKARLDEMSGTRAAPAAQPDDSDFKNFHRLLCERFGYSHDERDWKRDQLSLIEHVATTTSQPDEARDAAPAGFILLPINPTPEMIEAGNGVSDLYRMGRPELWGEVYRAMVRAAPLAPTAASPSHPDPELQKDAERYRWLRDFGPEGKPAVFINGRWHGARNGNGVGFALDAAVDAEMASAPHPVQQQEQGDDDGGALMRCMEAAYPIPDSPHQSVINHAFSARIAYRKGWDDRAALAQKGK